MMPPTQMRVWHSVSWPGQLAATHWGGVESSTQRRLVQVPEQHCLAFVQLEPSP